MKNREIVGKKYEDINMYSTTERVLFRANVDR